MLPFDCLSSIMLFLDDLDIFRLIQVDRSFYSLKEKEKLWNRLWLAKYPHNDIDQQLNMQENFLKCALVQKFIQLNYTLLSKHYKHHIEHSETPKRRLDRAMFIPMIGYTKDSNTIFPESLKQAFGRVNVHLPLYQGDASVLEVANNLINRGALLMKPKRGDILTFCETADEDQPSFMLYDGEKIRYSWRWNIYLPDIDMAWPHIAIDYWMHATFVPSNFKENFRTHLTSGPLPIQIDAVSDIYSWIECNGKRLYLFFKKNTDFDKSWNSNRFFPFDNSGDKDMFNHFGQKDGIEYLLFNN